MSVTFRFELWIDGEFVDRGESEVWQDAFSEAIRNLKDLIGLRAGSKIEVRQVDDNPLPPPEPRHG